MQQSIWQKAAEYVNRKKQKRSWRAGFGIAACLVVFCTVYSLILPALTLEGETYCGDTEHEHTLACYSNPEADVEDASVWEATLPNATGDIHADMIAMAESQVGYQESEKNYEVIGETDLKGYSRYGEWAGDSYGDWNGYFTGFIMNYANVAVNTSGDAAAIMDAFQADGRLVTAADGTATAGDVAFFASNGQTCAGVVTDIAEDGSVTVVAGDRDNKVSKETLSSELLGLGLVTVPETTEDTEGNVDPEMGVPDGTENPDGSLTPDTEAPTSPEVNPEVGPEQDQNPQNGEGEQAEALPEEQPLPEEIVKPEDVDAWAALVEPTFKQKLFRMFSFRTADSYDMANMLTNVKLQYQKNDGSWDDITTGTTVTTEDPIKCELSYMVQASTLDAEHKPIHYTLPVNITSDKNQFGPVYNNGDEVGNYVITDRELTITFNDNYVTQNQNGSPIVGHVNVSGKLNRINITDGDKVQIIFNDEIHYDITVTEGTPRKGDIDVLKSNSKLADKGLVQYTVEISSQEGTTDSVIFSDTMKGMLYERDFQVKDDKGQMVTDYTAPVKGQNPIKITLPKLNPNSKYIITYVAKPDGKTLEYYKGKTHANNKVTVSSKDNLDGVLKKEAQSNTDYELTRKGGTLSDDKKSVTWTITINEEHLDISDWTLKDILHNKEYTGKANISFQENGIEETHEITFPYTFPDGSNKEYKITYTTTVPELGGWQSNQVQLKLENNVISESNAGVGIGSEENVKKQVVTAPILTGNTVITKWNVHISQAALQDALTSGANITDQIVNVKNQEHYFTVQQIKDAYKSLLHAAESTGTVIKDFKGISYKSGWTELGKLDPNDKCAGFAYSLSEVGSGPLEYEYESSAEPSVGEMQLTNKLTVNSVSDTATGLYIPDTYGLKKYDATSGSEGETHHQWNELSNGKLTWKIELYVPESERNSEVVLQEMLPQGTKLTGLKITYNEYNQVTVPEGLYTESNFSGNLIYWDRIISKNKTFPVDKNGQNLKVTLTSEFLNYAKGRLTFDIEVKVDSGALEWQNGSDPTQQTAEVKNNVTVKGTGDPVGASQVQVLTRNPYDGTVQKSNTKIENANIVDYAVTVNPEGKDLLPNEDTLTLTDRLVIDHQDAVHANLVSSYVKVTKTKTQEQITLPYTYSKKENTPDAGKMTHELQFKVPDATPLKIEYRYIFRGENGIQAKVTNNAALSGIGQELDNSASNIEFALADSSADAYVQGIEFIKVEKGNHTIKLPNATFDLYRYDGTEYEKIQSVTSNTDGEIKINNDTLREKFVYNTAYKLVETAAPSGYQLDSKLAYEFYIKQGEVNVTKPADFTGRILYDGDTEYIENEKNTTVLKIIKKWLDVDGQILAQPSVNSITVKLYKSANNGDKQYVKDYEITAPNWELTLTDLEAKDKEGNPYTYSVEEVSVPGFKVEVDNAKTSEGSITITNTKSPEYKLPETGGPGIFWYLLTGAGLMLVSLLAYRKRNVH